MGSALSGRDFGQAGKTRPLHACLRKVDGGTAKIELERLGKPKRNCGREDSASEKRGSGDADGQWYVVASEPKAASAMVPWIVMEGI